MKTRFNQITYAYINFLKKSGNFIRFEKDWKNVGVGGFIDNIQKKTFIEDICGLSELIGLFILENYNLDGKYLSLEFVINSLINDKKLHYDKNLDKLNKKIKMLYKFGFIPKHITWLEKNKNIYN